MREEEEEDIVEEKGKEDMKPWEQHATVISIPRFDYKAPSSLLDHNHSGFLITCTIKREKSATKEAISILEKYLGSSGCDAFEKLEPSDVNVSFEKRKLCPEKLDGDDAKSAKSNEANNLVGTSGEVARETNLLSTKRDGNEADSPVLSLVKLTRSGLLLFTFPSNHCQHTVDILSDIFLCLGSGTLRPPLWCHRILPIQVTCSLKEKDLRPVVSKLVQQYLDDERHKLERPIKLVVLVELLPLSGVRHGSLVVAVSVLPPNLVSTKPRLCVKALVSDMKPAKAKS
ncbi:uncharacterized protein LOC143886756 isoform X2 [Tasmannia lanceolata]|uniref:uncharacterized protein LOC143886756 isoform X2 n=1 Tax=Tasmannia lanceolata TaxID=3420 RepID=UPI004063C1A9